MHKVKPDNADTEFQPSERILLPPRHTTPEDPQQPEDDAENMHSARELPDVMVRYKHVQNKNTIYSKHTDVLSTSH